MKIFIITPHYSDLEFKKKRELLLKIASNYNVEVLYGSNRGFETDVDESIALLESADSVLADLSLERPSCYFEVGFAQSQNKLVHLIAKLGTEIHQVRSRNKVHFYKSLSDYEQLLNNFFSNIIRGR